MDNTKRGSHQGMGCPNDHNLGDSWKLLKYIHDINLMIYLNLPLIILYWMECTDCLI